MLASIVNRSYSLNDPCVWSSWMELHAVDDGPPIHEESDLFHSSKWMNRYEWLHYRLLDSELFPQFRWIILTMLTLLNWPFKHSTAHHWPFEELMHEGFSSIAWLRSRDGCSWMVFFSHVSWKHNIWCIRETMKHGLFFRGILDHRSPIQ